MTGTGLHSDLLITAASMMSSGADAVAPGASVIAASLAPVVSACRLPALPTW